MSDDEHKPHAPTDNGDIVGFFYTKCPHCGIAFCIVSECKPDNKLGYLRHVEPSKDDTVSLFCPSCGNKFPLVIDATPKVMLDNYPFYRE